MSNAGARVAEASAQLSKASALLNLDLAKEKVKRSTLQVAMLMAANAITTLEELSRNEKTK